MQNPADYYIEIFTDEGQEARWRLRSTRNGQIVAVSGEGYEHGYHAVQMATRLFPEVQIRVPQ